MALFGQPSVPALEPIPAAITAQLSSTWLGAVDCPSWLKGTWETLPDHHATGAVTVTLRVECKKHVLRVGKHEVKLPAFQAGAERTCSERELALSKDVRAGVVQRLLEGLCGTVAPMLYEHDPRIGTRPVVSAAVGFSHVTMFPRCPLFDPPGFKVPRIGGEAPAQTWNGYGSCLLCSQPFGNGNPAPMWGGGNVGWVHERCWTAP